MAAGRWSGILWGLAAYMPIDPRVAMPPIATIPAPVPMWPPVPVFRPRTEQGLAHLRTAIALGVGIQALAIVTFILLGALLQELAGSPFPSAFPSSFLLMLPVLCASGIVAFVAAIFALMGFLRVHEARFEYGPDHARWVEYALVLFIVAAVLTLAGGGFSGLGTFGSPFTLFGGVPSPEFGVIILVLNSLGVVRGVFAGLVLWWTVRTFLTPLERTHAILSAIALGVGPAIPVAIYGVLLASPPSGTGALAGWFVAMAAGPGVELVGYALLLLVYSGILRRFRAGQYPPAIPPTPYMPVYFPPYPVYPWAPPVAVPPATPTPASPGPPRSERPPEEDRTD